MDIDPSTVSYIESGSSKAPLDRLDTYARNYHHHVVVHVVPEGEAVLPVHVARDVLEVVQGLDRLDPEDRRAVVQLAVILYQLPGVLRRTFRGQVDIWQQEVVPPPSGSTGKRRK